MKMSIFAFTLAVALAAGSAYSEMNAMDDFPGTTSGISDGRIDKGSKGSGSAPTEARAMAPERSNQGY